MRAVAEARECCVGREASQHVVSATKRKRLMIVCALDATAWCFLRPQMRELLRRGWDVHVCCSTREFGQKLTAMGVTVHDVAISRGVWPVPHIVAVAQLFKIFRRFSPAVVHVHTPVAAAVGRVAAWLAGVPVRIYTVHGFQYGDATPSWKRTLVLGIEKALGLMTTAMITVNEEDAITARVWSLVAGSRISCIRNGVALEHFAQHDSAAEASLRVATGIPEGVPVVGTIGRLTVEKGLLDFCDAVNLLVEEFPACHFVIIGKALHEERNPLTTAGLIDRLVPSARENVHFIDFTDQVRDWLHVMDVFVLASHREGLPVTVLEALAAGTPVVCTDIRGCREAIDNGRCGMLVSPRVPASIAAGIAELLRNPALRDTLAQSGKARAADCFDEDRASVAVASLVEGYWLDEAQKA
jgi:glycosyltransferase involved in cell wall biosynthesis